MRVLLAVDLKQDADRTVAAVQSWVDQLGAEVDLVYVDEFRAARPYAHDSELDPALTLEWERMRREDEAELGRLLALLPLARRGAIELATGAPAATIVALAPKYDLVAVATHGRTGLSHFWLGSVAERIVRTCTRPVLVLRLT
jgi:nucleotide-binding universal stress UspA family protein